MPGIVGALLGPAAFLSISIGLFLQSILSTAVSPPSGPTP